MLSSRTDIYADQETFGKLLDACVTFVGRSSDQGTWIRRGTKDSLTAGPINGRESPVPRVGKCSPIDDNNQVLTGCRTASDSKLNEKAPAGVLSPQEPLAGSELIFQVSLRLLLPVWREH